VIREGVFPHVLEQIPELVRALTSEVALQITGEHCPKIIRTRWVDLVEIFAFIINNYPKVHHLLALIDPEEVTQLYRHLYLLLLPLSLFSRVMESQRRILAQVIPAAREVLREWSELISVFSDNEVITGCVNVLTAHFLARFRRNSFEIVVTSFALSPLGRAEIRAREQGFQTHGEMLPVPEPKFVEKMHRKFQLVLQLSGKIPLDAGAVSAVPQETPDLNVMVDMGNPSIAESNDFVEPDEIPHAEEPPEPEDIPGQASFLELLDRELHTPFEHRLNENFLDGIIQVALGQVTAQGTYVGYPEDERRSDLMEWWMEDRDVSCHTHPDRYWRQIHGGSDRMGHLSHVALRFISLVCGEADIERLLCKQKHIQGESGSNYRMDTIHARLALHETR
jgi:hypothetical protein